MCTRHIPILSTLPSLYILHSNTCLLLITTLKSADHNGASSQQCYEQQKKATRHRYNITQYGSTVYIGMAMGGSAL